MRSPNALNEMVSPHRGPHEVWILVVVLCAVLIAELALRAVAPRLSGNIQHIHEIPSIATHLAKQPRAMLFLGNSLTNNGIDPALFATTNLSAGKTAVGKIVPDGTTLSDWYCIFRNSLAGLPNTPRVVVVGFAWYQLADQEPINASRLGGYFCSFDDIPLLNQTGVADHNNVLDFLAGTSSQVYVNREAIRNRILDTAVPHYRVITQKLNRGQTAVPAGDESTRPRTSYALLSAFGGVVRATGATLALVAMPVQNDYQIDPALVEAASRIGIALIDMRHTRGITPDMYLDPIHLNERGRHLFSSTLARQLPLAIQRQAAQAAAHDSRTAF